MTSLKATILLLILYASLGRSYGQATLDFSFSLLVDAACVSTEEVSHVYFIAEEGFDTYRWSNDAEEVIYLSELENSATLGYDFSLGIDQNSAVVTVEGTNDLGTQTVSKTINTDFHFAPVVDFTTQEAPTGCAPFEITFKNRSYSYHDNETLTYEWDFGDGMTSGELNPIHEFEDPGVYTVSLVVTDSQNCRAGNGTEAFTLQVTVLEQGQGDCN